MIVYGFTAIGIFAFSWVVLFLGTLLIPLLYLSIAEKTDQTCRLVEIILARKTVIKIAVVTAALAMLVTTSSMDDGRENIPVISHHSVK